MLDDKYRIEHLLAMGGMGAVYLGTHVKLRKRVAIKILNPQLSTKAMVERFHREAITASQIGHEGIAQVTDLGTSAEGEPFLVMEYLEGESLGARIEATGQFPIELACELGCSILAPLGAAHQAGIVHRDLKPDNVFLVRRSRGEGVKLLDFGISRAVGVESEFRLTKTGLVLGTPYYMSPEQARGESEISLAADIYAFGVILYEMLVGRVPVEGENYNQLMYRVLTGDFERPRAVRPEIPEELEQVILQAMAMNPEDRQGSASELELQLLPFCRPSFRQIERVSSSGFRPLPTPALGSLLVTGNSTPAAVAVAPITLDNPVVSQRLSPTPAERPSPTAETLVAPPSEPSLPAAQPAPPRRSRAIVIAAAIGAVAAVAAVTAVIASGRRGEPEPVTPPPVAVIEPRPEQAPPPPPKEETAPTQEVKPPPPPPATTAEVTLRFQVEPANAAISIDGKPVKDGKVTAPKNDTPHKLRITAPGYAAHEETIRFDETQKMIVQLSRAGRTTNPQQQRARVQHKVERIDSKSPYE